jgi:hypothetical protein
VGKKKGRSLCISRKALLAGIRRSTLKAENYTVAITFMHCNFVRIHQALRVTPAVAARVTFRLWENV